MTHKEAHERLARIVPGTFKIESNTWRHADSDGGCEIVVTHRVWIGVDRRSFEAHDLGVVVEMAETHVRATIEPLASADAATREFPVSGDVAAQAVA